VIHLELNEAEALALYAIVGLSLPEQLQARIKAEYGRTVSWETQNAIFLKVAGAIGNAKHTQE
jgi:hypothetical protein